jgi:Mrp family chromosome partitioning ATPase
MPFDNSQYLYCATSGPLPPNPGEMVSSKQFQEIIAEAEGYADYVLVDSPPALGIGDAASMASHVDGVIFVVKMLHTSRNILPSAQRFIDTIPCPTLGVVVTNYANSGDGYGYGYGYGYY